MIAEKSVLRGQFRLASGGESGLFFDMKQTLLLPEGLAQLSSPCSAGRYAGGRICGMSPGSGHGPV